MRHSLEQPVGGFGYALRGLRLVLRPELRAFILIPFLINLLVFGGLLWLGVQQFGQFIDWMLPPDGWLSYLRWLLWPISALCALLIVFFSFTGLANLLASPFNALLAERVELLLRGRTATPGGPPWKAVLPAIASELNKLLYFLLRAVPLLLLFLIPGLNLLAPLLWLLFSCWYLALQYADFPMGNHGIAPARQRQLLRQQRLTALGFGGGITLLMLVPLLNLLAMPAAVAGATALWCDTLDASNRSTQ